MNVIEIKNLHFGYRRKQLILEDLNLEVPAGSIYGFLGRNGAGKSTTIRNMLGLLHPQSGDVRLLGDAVHQAKRTLFRRVGTLIESPSLYPHLNADEHLRVLANYQTITKSRDDILNTVGLLEHRRKLVRHYSTGMKQRLGLALAIAHDPELLILDEPSNGLDPQGIGDIRRLILELHAQGKTILLSSHILSEIERMATHVGIIKQGRMVFEGTRQQLTDWQAARTHWELRTPHLAAARQELDLPESAVLGPGRLAVSITNEAAAAKLVRRLTTAQIDIYELRQQSPNLEELFLQINEDEA